jgi:hypothetical protein
VQPVEAVALEIVHGLGRLADAGNHDELVRLNVLAGQSFLDGHEHVMVAAAGAPAGLEFAVGLGVDHKASRTGCSRSMTNPAVRARPS